MKKFLAILLAAAMTLAFAACGSGEGDVSGTAGGKLPKLTKDTMKVGFVYIGKINDEGYTQAHDKGRLALEEMGIQCMYKEEVAENQESEQAIRDLIDQGCNVIYATSFGFMDYAEKVAKEHPEVYFGHCSGYKRLDNMCTYFGKIYQARYLSGIVAGLKTTKNKIGYVAAKPIPEVIRGINAFTLGLRSVNPEATVEVIWTDTWYDPAEEKQAAITLLNKGVDVIAQHQDTTMPVAAAEEAGVWACGYNCDMTEDGPHAHLTAPIWHWGIYVTEQVQAVIDGTWEPVNRLEGMNEGWVDISPLTENCAEGTEEAVEAAREAIINGELQIFSGEITDNEGNVVVAEGQTLTDEEILQITWFCEGITIN